MEQGRLIMAVVVVTAAVVVAVAVAGGGRAPQRLSTTSTAMDPARSSQRPPLPAADDGSRGRWSPAATIDSAVSVWHGAGLAFSGDGHALATLDGRGVSEPTRVLVAAPGTTRFRQIARAALVAPPAPFGERDVAYLRLASVPAGPHPMDELEKVSDLGVSLGNVDALGRWQRLARIDAYLGDLETAIAADPNGNVAVAWFQPHDGLATLWIALRRPGRATFDPAAKLAEAASYDGDSLSIAYGAGGDLVVVFQRALEEDVFGTLEFAARVKRAGKAFGPLQVLGPSRGRSSITTAVADDGGAVVAWGTGDGGELLGEGEGENAPWRVYAAALRPGAERFSGARLLEPGFAIFPVSGVYAAAAPRGVATVVWSGSGPGTREFDHHPLHVATTGPDGRFAARARLARNGAALGVVRAHDGTMTVLWGSQPDADAGGLERILASRRPAGARDFAAAEQISPNGPSTNSKLALDPHSDRPAALWIGARTRACYLEDECPVQALFARLGGA